jgi:hypothetical protein
MYRKITFLLITLVMASLVITPVGKANAQVETQVSAPDCPPSVLINTQDQNFLQSLPPECVKAYRTSTQNAGSQASAQDILPVSGNAGSNYQSELTGLAATYSLYLPLVVKNYRNLSGLGISGQVTYQGNPISSIPIELRFYNGSSNSLIATTTTQADGVYKFTSAPSLGSGQYYFALYRNVTNATASYVDTCRSSNLTSYTAGNDVAGGSFDIANIPQVSPPNGANVALPYTFQWTPRAGVPSDNYRIEISKDNWSTWWSGPTLGYVSQYVLNSLPSELSLNTQNKWDVAAFSPDGSWCYSFDQNRTVTFH